MKRGKRERGERKQGMEGDKHNRDKTLVSCYKRRMQDIVAHSLRQTSTQNNYRQNPENGAKHVKEILGRPTHYLFTQIFLSSHQPNCCYVSLLMGDDAHPHLLLFVTESCIHLS